MTFHYILISTKLNLLKEKNNFKITDQSDFNMLKRYFKTNINVGIGFDVHRLVPNRKLFRWVKN